jgi:hypothetical protein
VPQTKQGGADFILLERNRAWTILINETSFQGLPHPRKDPEYRQCPRPKGYELTAFAFFTILLW